MNSTVYLDTHFNVGVIDRRIFGGFLEHLGRAVYQGVYDPGNPLSDSNGFRQDVLEALRPLGMPVIRYPGGNYVSAADWRDAIGSAEQRPRRPDFAWRSTETNQFGTDEFMAWCKAAGTDPMMAVNLGTLGAAEAAQLVEYCNLPTGTAWADRRKHNGRADPYGVKLWCLGNEMDGPWQAGHVTADVYAQRAFQASVVMKGLDPTIQTVACGSSGNGLPTYLHWDRTVLEYCWNTIDYLSAHRYSDNYRNDTAWFLAEGLEIDRIITHYAGLFDYAQGVRRSKKKIHLSFDEWNVWYRVRGHGAEDGRWREAPPLLEEMYNLEDALVCAQYLSAFVRRADVVKVACIAQIVNVIAPVLTRRDGILIQSIYYPFLFFSQYAKGVSLTPSISGPLYKAGDRGEAPALDVSASFDESTGDAAVFLVNRDASKEMTIDLHFADRRITAATHAQILGGGDVKAGNTWEEPNRIKPRQGTIAINETGGARVTIPAPGFGAICLKTVAR